MTTQTGQDTGTMVVHGQRVARMAADPEVTGDVLAVGIAMSAIIDAKVDERLTLKRIQYLAFGAERDPYPKIRRALEADVRRYVPPDFHDTCDAPTPRKARCGRNPNAHGYLTDWATGELIPRSACSHHGEWFQRVDDENRAAKPEVGGPSPYANAGGRLARHFPEVDWPTLYRKVDKRWEPMPEREPAEPSAPTLTVVTDDTPKKPLKQRGQQTSTGKTRLRGRGGLHPVPNTGDDHTTN